MAMAVTMALNHVHMWCTACGVWVDGRWGYVGLCHFCTFVGGGLELWYMQQLWCQRGGHRRAAMCRSRRSPCCKQKQGQCFLPQLPTVAYHVVVHWMATLCNVRVQCASCHVVARVHTVCFSLCTSVDVQRCLPHTSTLAPALEMDVGCGVCAQFFIRRL